MVATDFNPWRSTGAKMSNLESRGFQPPAVRAKLRHTCRLAMNVSERSHDFNDRDTVRSVSRANLTMNRPLLAAAVLAAFTAGVHLIVGSAEIATPLLNSPLAVELSYLLYACWHLVSCALAFSAVAFFVCALGRHRYDGRLLALFISWLWLAFGAVFLVIGFVGADGSLLFKLPQWLLLLPVGVLGLLGSASFRGS
jgi:hypothetical protein